MAQVVQIGDMADAIMDEMEKYASVATDALKDAVKDSAKTVKKEIEATAPVATGKYKKSWRAKATEETSTKLTMVVHSATRYQIAHLLEHGHAKRGGGRVAAIPHIAPAEEKGVSELEKKIEEGLSG